MCDHPAYIVGQCSGVISEQEIFVLCPADQSAGLDLGPAVLTLQDGTSTVLVEFTDLGCFLAGIASYIHGILYVRHDQTGTDLFLCRESQVQFLHRSVDHLSAVPGTGIQDGCDTTVQIIYIIFCIARLCGHAHLHAQEERTEQSYAYNQHSSAFCHLDTRLSHRKIPRWV